MNDLILQLYRKPLSNLRYREAATVVAVTLAPGRYFKNPDALKNRTDILLQRRKRLTDQYW